MRIFQDKNIVLGITGSIAAYKAVALASQLHQWGARVRVAMTPAATHFVGPLTFESLTGFPVATDVLSLGPDSSIEHVRLAKDADLLVIAPATANTIARLASGLADDVISAIALDTRAPILIAPAMETGMWENPATQENVNRLRDRGVLFVEPGTGHLASGASGPGRLADNERIFSAMRSIFGRYGDLVGRRVVVSSGGTSEAIDPVRFITNHSSGRMGFALAEEALLRGADVELITTVTSGAPIGARITRVETTGELYQAVLDRTCDSDVLIMAAAPADFRPVRAAEKKIKKEQSEKFSVEMIRNPDVLEAVARRREQDPCAGPRVTVGFAAETDSLIDNARSKLERKRLDLIVANPVPQTFGSDQIQATLLDALGEVIELDPMPKGQLARIIFDRIEPRLR
ncbi:MAG: bifunctional phosphopantothenoylcysteine decarboxylase/phosphopantothenate--cysteine ligase CoaBC [Rudaea sp.]